VIYELRCDKCIRSIDIHCSVAQHAELVKPGIACACGGHMSQYFSPPKIVWAREGFPKKDPRWEHVSDEPMEIRDKAHLKDICEQNGSVSRYLEDAV
jgi:predicted nucleic acid-binding Zn ribbon protein